MVTIRRNGRTRLGNLLLIAGALLIALPAVRWLQAERDYRRQLAEAPPSPVMLSRPGDAAPGEDGPGSRAAAGLADAAGDERTAGGRGTVADGTPATTGDGAATGGGELVPTLLYHISIPRLGVTYPVNEGVDNPVLDLGPGHYPQTVLPGETGNAAMAGHRTRFGRPSFFYRLDDLEPGDLLHIHYPDRDLTFVVERVFITDPYDLSVIAATDYPALTLTTCDPPGSDEMRLIVQARLQSPLAAESPHG